MTTSSTALPIVSPRPHTAGDLVRIEVDTRLPGMRLGRKVYKTAAKPWRLDRPHVHNSPHHLVCVTGTCVVAIRAKDDEDPRLVTVAAGSCIIVPGGLPHQLRLDPYTMVASFFPPMIWLAADEDLAFFPGDWFA